MVLFLIFKGFKITMSEILFLLHPYRCIEDRDKYLYNLGFLALPFNDLEVLQKTEDVMEKVFQTVCRAIEFKNPPNPPL